MIKGVIIHQIRLVVTMRLRGMETASMYKQHVVTGGKSEVLVTPDKPPPTLIAFSGAAAKTASATATPPLREVAGTCEKQTLF